MSILLDALRKSEKQEHLGSLPDIHSADDSIPDREHPPWLIPLLIIAVIMLVLTGGWFAWKAYYQESSLIAPPEFSVSADGNAPTGEQTLPAENAAAAGQANGRESTASESSVAPSKAQDGRQVSQPRSPVESLAGGTPYRPANPTAQKSGARPERRSGAQAAQAVAPESANRSPEETAEATSTRPQRRQAAASGRSQPSAQGQEETTSRNQPGSTAPAPISYWELPANIRDTLPELKINVLVWAKEPDERFILIGGKRYARGSEVTDGLRVVNIERDRVIFRHRMYRFFVKQ